MFVEALKRQNPALISAALSLWQQGKIAPDSWVIDVDQVLENGKRLIETARLYGIELYLMTKQSVVIRGWQKNCWLWATAALWRWITKRRESCAAPVCR